MCNYGKTRLVRFAKDQVLFKEGDESRELYIIRAGKVRVTLSINKGTPLVDLGKGSFVGEMSFISGIPRTATVTAIEPVMANVISMDVLNDEQFGLSSWSMSIAKVLVQRIHKTTSLLAQYLKTKSSEEIPQESALIDGDELVISSLSQLDPERLYLRGFLGEKTINSLKNKIRELKVKGRRPIVLDFSNVVDIDRMGLDYLMDLANSGTNGEQDVEVENIQLIRNKVLAIKGIHNIVTTTRMPIMRVEQNEMLIEQDQVANTMYVVKIGQFKVFKKIEEHEVVLSHAEAGDVLGEMALVKEGARSAHVQAEKASVVYEVKTKDFYQNTYHVPDWFMDILKGLVHRLRQTNNMLESMIKDRKKKVVQKTFPSPLGIIIDSENPGKFILQGNLTAQNTEYISLIVNSLLSEGKKHFVLDLSRVEQIDRASIQQLLNMYARIQGRGGEMHFAGPQKNITMLLRQYDIEVVRPSAK